MQVKRTTCMCAQNQSKGREKQQLTINFSIFDKTMQQLCILEWFRLAHYVG